MYRKKKKNIIVVASVIVVSLLLLSVTGIFAFGGRNKADKGYDLVDVSYSIGALDADGRYKESKGSLYTKEAFECETSVKGKLDFESTITWQLFFYDENDNFVESTTSFDGTSEFEVPDGATCARVMITPVWDKDVAKDDQVINLFNKKNFADQLVISVLVPEEEAE